MTTTPVDIASGITYPLVTPDTGPDITLAEYQAACRIADTLREIVKAAPGIISAANIPPALANPSETWTCPSGNPVHGALISQADVLNPSYEFVNRLRLYSYLFTGYNLTNVLTDAPLWSWTDAIAGHIPEQFAHNAPDWSVGAFQELMRRLPPHLICSPPRKLGETGWLIEDGIVNRDVMAYQERIALLDAFGVLDELEGRKNVRILEIGGGYGGLAYFLKQQLPDAQYYICDLPLSLFFSATYLTLTNDFENNLIYNGEDKATLFAPRDGFTFVPNHLFDDLMTQPFDLVLNTMSFAEMPAATVEAYARGAAHIVGDWGFLFDQNFDNAHYERENFCEPKRLIAQHFQHKWEAGAQTRWGHPNLWMNHANPFGRQHAKPARLPALLPPPTAQEAEGLLSDQRESQATVQATLAGFVEEIALLQKTAGSLMQKVQHLQAQLNTTPTMISELTPSFDTPDHAVVQSASPAIPYQLRVLYLSDRAESGHDPVAAMADYKVTVVSLSHRNVATGAHLEIDPAQPDAALVRALQQQEFDVVAMPYGSRLHFRGIGLVPLAQQLAPRILVVFADGTMRLYEGSDTHRLQYNSSYLDTMFRYIPDAAGREILEVGCSDGLVCDLMRATRPRKIVGIDMLPDVGCNFPNPVIEYARMDAMDMTFESNRFDLCYSIATMEHVADPFTALQEIKRVTKPGGYAYVQAGPFYHTPFGHHMFGLFDAYPWIHLRRSEAEIIALGRKLGVDKTLQQDRGFDITSYVHGMLSREHINGLRHAEYRLEEFMASPDIEKLYFARSYEGENLLTDALRAELTAYTDEDLTAHGFDLVFRIRE